MYNNDLPTRAELPSSKQLLRSTFIAVVTAAVLLVTIVLPSEYGIDPTGVGRLLNLTPMGEIKVALAKEAALEATIAANLKETGSVQLTAITTDTASASASVASEIPAPVTASAVDDIANPQQSHQLTFALAPGAAAEIKVAMNKDAIVNYQWSTTGGVVNYDNHGDNSSISYFGYGKGKSVAEDKGSIKAAFDGKHGWYWRNRTKGAVSVTLNTQGDYHSFKRVI